MTRRKKLLAISGVIVVVIIAVLVIVCQKYQHTSEDRSQNCFSGQLETVKCTHDEDGDGVPDDEDILDNALKYIATCPKYKGKYYEGGYPTDNYGVCSDIIAFALRDAGYDLRKLVNEDIKANPSSYEDETPDIDIDFRRVRNLLAYFKNHANSLTTDISKISEWQAGDIVIFDGHIGLLSDRRNADGVPYIIHHVSGWQESYEEDILGTRDDLVAHFRVW